MVSRVDAGQSPSTSRSTRLSTTTPTEAAPGASPEVPAAAPAPATGWLPTTRTTTSTSRTLDAGQLAPGATVALDGQLTTSPTGVDSATATAAFKALLGSTSIDTSGTGLTITNSKLSQAQFEAAVTTLFGGGAKVSNTGTFTFSPDAGVSASLVNAFKNAAQSLSIASDGSLQVKQGQVSGSLSTNIVKLLGANTLLSNNTVVFKDNAFASAQLTEELKTTFGDDASLDGTLSATVERNGLRTATATAAYKALLGNTSIDTTGTGLTLTNHSLTKAQFQAAVKTVFGANAEVTNSGTFAWAKDSGVSAEVAQAYKATAGAVQIDARGALSVKNDTPELQANLRTVLGSSVVVSNNTVTLKDNRVTASLDESVTHQFGPSASLAGTFAATASAKGLESATATAAYKTLLGATSIDTSGTGLTIKNNSLTQAQFKAAVQTVFGPDAKLSGEGTFTWSKDSGVSSSLVAAFKQVTGQLELGANGSLTVKAGQASGTLGADLKTVLGDNTLIAKNQVTFKDNRFVSAQLKDELVTKFGASGSLDATLEASLAASGERSAKLTAAYKALHGGTSIDTSGTGLTITNRTLTQAQLKAAVQTVFGENATLSNTGTFTYTKDSGVSADLVSSFKTTAKALTLQADGTLSVKDGKVSGSLSEALRDVLGDNTIIANNQVTFKDSRFQSATLDDQLVTSFGPDASLTTGVQATIDGDGLKSAKVLAAYKALRGGATIDTGGSLTITNKTLTEAQFRAAVQTVLGPNAKLSTNSTYTWSKDSGVSASLAAAFEETTKHTTLKADGTLQLKAGALSGSVSAQVKTLLGDDTLVANNTIIFNQGHLEAAKLEDSLTHEFGKQASLTSTVKASVTQAGLADASVSVAAFKRLKTLGDQGAIDLKTDGTVVIKNNQVDRAEVSALLSVMSGKEANLTTGGTLVYKDGKVDPTFTSNLVAAWGSTSLDAHGSLVMANGKPELNAKVSALFGGADVKGGASIEIKGTSSAKLDLKLASLGDKTKVDSSGSLVLDHGRITGAGLTTNLVTTGATPADVSLSGLVSLTDTSAEANVKAQVKAGLLGGALGVGGKSSVQLYSPFENSRKAVEAAGGVWAQREATFQLNANAGVNAPIMVGAVPVQLGFKSDAAVTRSVRTLSVHPSKEDALSGSPVTVLHPPGTVDQVLAMRPYEQFTDSGARSIGLGGSVSVGYGVGPASVSAGGSVYYQVSGNLQRDVERLDGNKVRVRFRKGDGSTNINTLSASVGVNGGAVLGNSALASKAAPIVEQVAKLGVSASFEKMKQNDSVIDVTIDASTPQGRAALEHVLHDDLSEAQYWAGYENSGVTLNSQVTTNISAQTRKADLNLGPLNIENMSRFLDKQLRVTKPSEFTFTQALDQTTKHDAVLPWNPDRSTDMRFLHESKVVSDEPLPDVSTAPSTEAGALTARLPAPGLANTPTLANSQALLAVRVKVTDPATSLSDLKSSLDPTLAVLQDLGFSADEYKKLGAFRAALEAGLAPPKKALIKFGNIGDNRFEKSTIDLEGFIGPKAFANIFQPNGVTRSAAEFQRTYLEASGSALSTSGTLEAIGHSLGARLVPAAGGTFDVVKKGHTIGSLSAGDIEDTRQAFIDLARRPPDPRRRTARPSTSESATGRATARCCSPSTTPPTSPRMRRCRVRNTSPARWKPRLRCTRQTSHHRKNPMKTRRCTKRGSTNGSRVRCSNSLTSTLASSTRCSRSRFRATRPRPRR